ncbi:MAG: bifunctional proline dehydrogenase/L-glutamate gamma-semialdehyde dehydrogenase PutA [Panacagrimonas sp.]
MNQRPSLDSLRGAITRHWLAPEAALIAQLVPQARFDPATRDAIQARAADGVRRVRARGSGASPLDAFMREYDLGSEEGVLLMCLAEALLRIPDPATAQMLIADKLGSAAWHRHLGQSDSLFVNASTWGLLLTGRLVRLGSETESHYQSALGRLVGRASEPAIRLALRQTMRMMAQQFVMGRSIGDALARARERGVLCSFDMLGEAALTAEDVGRYRLAYGVAIEAIGEEADTAGGSDPNAAVTTRPGISVKLSALHPRFEPMQATRVLRECVPHLLDLALLARQRNLCLTVDAEEADRLELSLDVIAAVFADPRLSGWEGFGLAVQALQKRALPVIDWLGDMARRAGRRIQVRLVKGAYWDTEIKRAQEQGLSEYPVFTRKAHTDVSYIACARRLIEGRDHFYPMFATHNAHTIAAVQKLATGSDGGYEFQRLHGMGEALYEVMGSAAGICRVYAPVGTHEDLLPYLVRRLLENGANTSFVNRIYDEQLAPALLVRDPVDQVITDPPHALPLPAQLYGSERRNSAGLNLADPVQLQHLCAVLAISPVMAAVKPDEASQPVCAPADRRRVLGYWKSVERSQVRSRVETALVAQDQWNSRPVAERAALLEAASDQLESSRDEFLKLLVFEAGKTLADAVAELRETVDFLRYYAAQARRLMSAPQLLPGPTGEDNQLQLHGRGVWVCISPWNFPLAIFTGQIAACLVTGNSVVAKPAEQTPLIALRMITLLHQAGVPREVLQLAPGDGRIGAQLVAEPCIAGVVFTGSVAVAQSINRTLAARTGPLAILIAETGGQNAMIADSSALPEQVVRDALRSAFGSAGQRCSALRVLYLQEEIADRVIAMLRGAMRELVVGDPARITTDVGPVIDEDARSRLQAHIAGLERAGRLIEQLPLPESCAHGFFVAPCLAEIAGIEALDAEHFGPILHVARFAAGDLDGVVDHINASGYGLTLGIHSRIESNWRRIQSRARVGNVYVNRGMTGAVVGSQPFGGEGLSGTGPKAGGPHYLLRLVVERSLSVNSAAVGGNAGLLAGHSRAGADSSFPVPGEGHG